MQMTVVCIEDLRALARRRLPGMLFDYLEGGSWDKLTLRANRADFERIRFRPRVLVDVSQRSLTARVFGAELRLPLADGSARELRIRCVVRPDRSRAIPV